MMEEQDNDYDEVKKSRDDAFEKIKSFEKLIIDKTKDQIYHGIET